MNIEKFRLRSAIVFAIVFAFLLALEALDGKQADAGRPVPVAATGAPSAP